LPLVGFILCISAAVILVGYNAKHSPESLKSSLLVIIIVVVFSVIYNKLGKEMKTVLDEDLRREING
jgi:chromate transport protein ChrA